jgi:hypothetical protein
LSADNDDADRLSEPGLGHESLADVDSGSARDLETTALLRALLDRPQVANGLAALQLELDQEGVEALLQLIEETFERVDAVSLAAKQRMEVVSTSPLSVTTALALSWS